MDVKTSHCGVSNGFTHGLVSLTERIHHQDRVHTQPYVMSHNNRVHTRPHVMSHNNRVYTRPYVMSHNNRVHTRPYVMSHNNRVHTRPCVMSHLRCWHVPTIMHYEYSYDISKKKLKKCRIQTGDAGKAGLPSVPSLDLQF
jgi:hypothetical protein